MRDLFSKMLCLLLCGIMLFGMVPLTVFAEGEEDMYITNLRVNNLIEPIGIDTVPTFRWVNNMLGYARSQSAYRIIVASTAAKAAAHDGDVWDSGKVESNLNYDIMYGGSALASCTEYYFAVQVWDEDGNSVWSDVSKFATGFFDDAEWSAKWIGMTDGDSVPCDINLNGANWIWYKNGATTVAGTEYFRKHFTVDENKEVDEVLLATSMDDYGYLFVNRANVLTVKKETNAWKTGRVVNITPFVEKGDNIFGARVVNTGSSAGFIAKIEVRYTDGSVDTTVTNRTWKCSDTVTSTSGWERAGFNDTKWGFPNQAVLYGGNPWATNVVMPSTMQVNVGGSAPMLRKSFAIAKEVNNAKLYISGLGLYELYVNGKLPDDTVLNPAHTQYDDTVHYRVYNVTDLLTSGKNALAVELGNYFYNCDFYTWMNWNTAAYRDNPKLLLELHIDYTDGTSEVVVSDESWKTYEYGPTTYNNVYLGEHYDARRAVDGWTNPAFDDRSWKNAVSVAAPTGDLVFENMEPLRRMETFKPEVCNKGGGTYIIKNPVMTTGWARIQFSAPEGTEITIRYCEKMDEQGFAITPLYGYNLQIDKYICHGEDDIYEPKYSYKGFRYIQIENYDGELTEEDVACYFIANDIQAVSSFETGDSRINLLNELMVRTMFNNVQSKMTDTPVYEKNGWTGDFNFALESYNFNFDIANLNQKFMIDMRDTTNSKGVVGQTAPSANTGGSNIPIWTTAFINGYYENWRVNGITTAFEKNYDVLRLQMVSYISDIEANGWVWKDSGYADYHSPGQTSNAPEGAAIVGSAYVYQAAIRMAEMAEHIGKTADAAEYRSAAAKIKTAFNAKFYDAQKGYYDTGYWKESDGTGRTKYRQTSNLIPLAFGFCPDAYKESVVASIVNDIAQKGTHIDVGCVGVKYIFPVLSAVGYNELCMELLYQDTYPSWGYWINQDTTTLWEGYEDFSRSRNHYFLGTYTDWFYKNLAGVRDFVNGFETVVLKPEIQPELGFVKYSLETVRGTLKSHWRFTEDNKLVWDVTIPVGTTATVYLPAKADVSAYKCIHDNGDSLTVPSGAYTFIMNASAFDVDKSLLKRAIEKTKALSASEYTKDSWNALQSVISECEKVIANQKATQVAVCSATANLENALNGLCVNERREMLSALISCAETYRASNFETNTFEKLSGILASAKNTLADKSVSDAELEKAFAALETATNELAKHSKGNVALGKTVVASSTHTGAAWGIENLTDGDVFNLSGNSVGGWTSNMETSYDHREFVGVDLGAVYKVNRVQVMPAGVTKGGKCVAFPRAFTVSVSADGETWTTIYTTENYPTPTTVMQTFDFDTQDARYVRFEGTSLNIKPTDGNRYRMQLAELEVYYIDSKEVKLTIGSRTAYINGVAQTLDAAPINRNNRTMLPVRFLANTFGVPNEGIKWDAATRTATLTNSDVTIVVTIGAPTMTVNGKTVALDSPAIIENDRTYLPVRAIANALGVSNDHIAWDAATNTATLKK